MANNPLNFRDYCVLYVDDEEANQVVFEAAYGDDFNVVTACSGLEALELMGQRRFAVVMSDYRMPGMTGVELLEQVRMRFPETARVLATAYSKPETAIAAINRAGVSHFVRKPFDDTTVRQVIRDAIRATHHEEALRHLRMVMIERERMAGTAAARAKILHDLINMSDVVDSCCASLEELLGTHDELPKDVHSELKTLRSAVNYVVRLHARSRGTLRGHHPALHEADEIMQAAAQLACNIDGRRARVIVEECGLSVYADRIDVSRILVNLMTNAAHSIEESGTRDGEIRVSAYASGNRTILQVSDNGPGIPLELRDQIFDLHFSTRAPEHGSGLGLSICRELAGANDAQLGLVESGTGACFELVLQSRRMTLPRQMSA